MFPMLLNNLSLAVILQRLKDSRENEGKSLTFAGSCNVFPVDGSTLNHVDGTTLKI